MSETVKEPRIKCGLIMPISSIDGCSEEHWTEVRGIIRESLLSLNYQVELVSDSNEVGVIQNRIVNNIYKSDIVVCDVSGKNPNVMFELGMRLAFDKPTVIIKDDKTNYSFDTAIIEHIEYPRDLHYQSIVDFKNTLNKKVKATYEASQKSDYTTFLKHFGEFKISKVSEKVISSEAYILKAIHELTSSINRLENNGKTPKIHENLYDERARMMTEEFEDVFKNFMLENKLQEFELGDYQNELYPLVIKKLVERFNLEEPVATKLAHSHMEDQIMNVQPF
jgi:nucleoside 2-deoxyribosyltransferase